MGGCIAGSNVDAEGTPSPSKTNRKHAGRLKLLVFSILLEASRERRRAQPVQNAKQKGADPAPMDPIGIPRPPTSPILQTGRPWAAAGATSPFH